MRSIPIGLNREPLRETALSQVRGDYSMRHVIQRADPVERRYSRGTVDKNTSGVITGMPFVG